MLPDSVCVRVSARKPWFCSSRKDTTVYNLCSCLTDWDNTLVRRKSVTNGATASGLFRWTWWPPGTVTIVCWNRQGWYNIWRHGWTCSVHTCRGVDLRFYPVSCGEVLMWIPSAKDWKIIYKTHLLLWKKRFWTGEKSARWTKKH